MQCGFIKKGTVFDLKGLPSLNLLNKAALMTDKFITDNLIYIYNIIYTVYNLLFSENHTFLIAHMLKHAVIGLIYNILILPFSMFDFLWINYCRRCLLDSCCKLKQHATSRKYIVLDMSLSLMNSSVDKIIIGGIYMHLKILIKIHKPYGKSCQS
jgi:hypothetical protein